MRYTVKHSYMKRYLLLSAALVALPIITPGTALANIDCHYPVTEKQWTGNITTGVRVRDLTCMEESVVLGTVTSGTTVAVLGEADGWYLIQTSTGLKGFIWQDFLSITSKDGVPTFSAPVVVEPEETPIQIPAPSTTLTGTLKERVKGRILLQVQEHGEAWYVRPEDSKRYYMKDGPTAYEMMRAFGLGIAETDFAKLNAGNLTLKTQLKGKIVLRVQLHGEAYYIHPADGSLHYLKDGDEAYRIMRELSLGITNADLLALPMADFEEFRAQFEADRQGTVPTGDYQNIGASVYQKGTVPAEVDLLALNQYWLGKINRLRAANGLRQLVLDQRWVDTATEWASYMGENNLMTHDRPDGKTMHQWIDTKGLPFTVRYSEGGWTTNYFTENISWGLAQDGTTEAVKQVLDETLSFYLSEASSNGPHYRTIYYPDWNSVGVGFYFAPQNDGYKVFCAFHYGSLIL